MTPQQRARLEAMRTAPVRLGRTPGKKGHRSSPQARGYIDIPGTGPEGETCKSCAHLARVSLAKVYLKCGLNRARWTGGGGSDVRARSPACRKWEAKQS